MAHTKQSVKNPILSAVILAVIAFLSIGYELSNVPSDNHEIYRNEYRKMENALRNYNSAALMYYTDNDEWPPAGEHLPESPMVVSLDQYGEKSFDKERFSHLLIKEIPSGSKRFYLGLRPGERSPLTPISIQSYDYSVERNKLDNLFRADGLPYSGEIIGSGDVFVPMNFHTSKGCL